MDPQSRPGEFSPVGGGGRRAEIRLGLGASSSSPHVGCTFSGAESHDRLGGGHEPGGKVTRWQASRQPARAYKPPWWTRLRAEDACRGVRPRAVRVRSTRVSLSRSGPGPRAWHGLVGLRRLGSVANRSAPHPTRLETRTKESSMCASHGVARNPKAQ